ncbi:spore coat protein GerQ [Melghirimyces profundicolus]|uniref:Spore coat protein GerQ n=1 Tax=Melghirimyces profundicolus TaxID=1242148 RepID=A0A2T6BCC0_9BACL|nr:spore coat protein GerQ [Melghirimyces profundicolus]PTX53666.1 spore coat protein GerQ [Melghirimyces profundicolus]
MYWNQPPIHPSAQGWTSQRREERVYTEDLLHQNIGKEITFYQTYENNPQWPAKVLTGTLREVGRDFVLVRDRETGKDHILMNINIDFYVFETQPANLVPRRR